MTGPVETQAVYNEEAKPFDRHRNKALFEKNWLDRFAAFVPSGGHVLDLGCGSGEPIAAYLAKYGFHVTGVDASPAMIDLARAKVPDGDWQLGDMRTLGTDRTYDGILAWNSFFHLTREDQRITLPRLARMLQPGGPLLFTTGTGDGEAWGTVAGRPVYHASLTTRAYTDILATAGCIPEHVVLEDPACAGHSVFLARKIS